MPPDESWRDLEIDDLTDEDLLDLMRDDESPVGKAWRIFRTARARLELLESRKIGILKLRREELGEVIKLLRAAGVGIRIDR